MRRVADLILGFLGIVITAPVVLPTLLAIWCQDYADPFYRAPRVGRRGKMFTMLKLRSMVVHADSSGVDSTSVADRRITAVGRFVRRFKLDELGQLVNVIKGEMSLVGPRPNVARDVALYTEEERRLLDVLPGITDISSIVFSDEGEILKDSADPDLLYNQIIRPWKSRLGLLCAADRSMRLYFELILLTVIAIVSKRRALSGVRAILRRLGAEERLVRVAAREEPLYAFPPPGSSEVPVSRTPQRTMPKSDLAA